MKIPKMLSIITICGIAILMSTGCGDTTDGASMTSNELTEQSAREVLQGYLQETLSVLPAGTTLKEYNVSPSLDCDDNAVSQDGPKFASYVTVAEGMPAGQEVRFVDTVVDHWQELGWTLRTDYRERYPDEPFVSADIPDGYGVSVTVSRNVGLQVKGSTPCFAAATELDHVSPVTIRQR